MKKIIALILSALTAFAFVACGEKETKKLAPETAQTGETGQTSTATETTEQKTEEIKPIDLTNGTLYTLREACDKNLLTQTELMSAAYYHFGEVVQVVKEPSENWVMNSNDYAHEYSYVSPEEWTLIQRVPFTPQGELGSIPMGLEEAVRDKYCEKEAEEIRESIEMNKQTIQKYGSNKYGLWTTVEEFSETVTIYGFYGEYDGKYVIEVSQSLYANTCDYKFPSYGGFLFKDSIDLMVYVLT